MSSDANMEHELDLSEPTYTEEENKILFKGLPKWPHLIIIGKPVTRDQAFDIIFRTDGFLTDTCKHAGGNNHAFNAIYHRDSGIAQVAKEKEQYNDAWLFDMQVTEALREKIKFVRRKYIRNDWTSSPMVGGPHGFCSPEGEIYHDCNVGKWPCGSEVFEDLKTIVKEWPFLEFKASLYSHEDCECHPTEHKGVVMSFVAENGVVRVTEEDFDLLNAPRPGARDMREAIRMISAGCESEQGLPWRWMMEYAKKVKALLPSCTADAHEWATEHEQRRKEWKEYEARVALASLAKRLYMHSRLKVKKGVAERLRLRKKK